MTLEPVYAEPVKTGELPADAVRISTAQQQLIGLEYGVAEYSHASRTIRAAARVGVDENRLVLVQSKLEGFIDKLYVHSVGERVTQGQPLLSIYNRRTYSMAQMQFLQATMDNTGMTGPAADLANPNQRRLADAEALRNARLQLEMLGFTEDQIQAVGRAHQPLTSVPIHSPINGVIIEFHAALNQKLGMEPLLAIADLSTVWVTADFLASDGTAIRSGQSATLTVPYLPGKVFRGMVDAVLPELEPDTHSLKVRLRFDNPSLLLKPEMSGEVELFPRRRYSTAAAHNGCSWISATDSLHHARSARANTSRGASRYSADSNRASASSPPAISCSIRKAKCVTVSGDRRSRDRLVGTPPCARMSRRRSRGRRGMVVRAGHPARCHSGSR